MKGAIAIFGTPQAADRLVYEFVLRKGVRFHNGDPVTAEDVRFSFERYRGIFAKALKERVADDNYDPILWVARKVAGGPKKEKARLPLLGEPPPTRCHSVTSVSGPSHHGAIAIAHAAANSAASATACAARVRHTNAR